MNCAHCLDPESNHTTAQHELAMQPMCRACHEVSVHEEDERCPECVQEAYEAREQDYYDALAKDEYDRDIHDMTRRGYTSDEIARDY